MDLAYTCSPLFQFYLVPFVRPFSLVSLWSAILLLEQNTKKKNCSTFAVCSFCSFQQTSVKLRHFISRLSYYTYAPGLHQHILITNMLRISHLCFLPLSLCEVKGHRARSSGQVRMDGHMYCLSSRSTLSVSPPATLQTDNNVGQYKTHTLCFHYVSDCPYLFLTPCMRRRKAHVDVCLALDLRNSAYLLENSMSASCLLRSKPGDSSCLNTLEGFSVILSSKCGVCVLL